MEQACDDSDQREGGQSDQHEFNVSVSKAKGSTQIGNNTKVIHHHNQQSTSTSQINVVNINGPTAFIAGGDQALSNNGIYCIQPPGTRPGLNHDVRRHIDVGEQLYDGYLEPVPISVLKRAALLDKKSPDVLPAGRGQPENGDCSQPVERLVPSVSTSIGNQDENGADIIHTSLVLSHKELVEEFCSTNEIGKRKELTKRINIRINCFSVDNTESCDVRSAESILRTFFLQADQKSVEDRIGIYCHHLIVMLQHGLQPETINGEGNATVRKLLNRLMDIVKPSVYYPTSILRKDIETVIEMLSLFLAKSKKEPTLPKNVTKCFNKITCMRYPQEKKVKWYLEKYLKTRTWIHVYLIITWLKIKVLVDRENEKHLNIVLTVIIHYAASLHKWDQSYRWKFTITAVESLKEIIEIKAEKDLQECNRAIDALIDFYDLLERRKKKVKECIEIFYKKARVLLYIDNLQIRSKLLANIFKDLETSSQEMTKERLKQSETLHLESIETHHSGSFAFIFRANYKGCSVAVKCSKLSKKFILKKYASPTHFSYELQFLRNLRKKNHPHIIQLIQDDHHLQCLVLEYISFGSLRMYLLNRRSDTTRPAFDELILIAVKIAGALELLEEEGIIHLALQARNVLVHHNGDVKLTGFQFCRTPSQIKENGVRNVVLESHFKWMDRNALEFKSVVPRTVSWSFGVFLYELLTLGCEPYSRLKKHPDSDVLKREALTSLQAKIFVIRGGKLPKESCIPDSCFQIISTKCCEENDSDRITFPELQCLLLKEIESLKNVKMNRNPPPRIEPSKEEFRLEEYDPGIQKIAAQRNEDLRLQFRAEISAFSPEQLVFLDETGIISPHDDVYPFSHLDILDSNWNLGYSTEKIEEIYLDEYTNADTSIREPVLGIMKWNEKGSQCKQVIVVEYMEFKDRKLVEQLQQLDCPELVKVLHFNPFGPAKLEMISESFPEGNIRDAMLYHPALRDNLKTYIPQAGSAVMYLHSQGIVHRSVKLENFLMGNQSMIKLGRLGMSMKELDENAVYADPRDKDDTMNTTDARWNAPEVLQWGSFSKESDVWSFGVVLWEFLRIWNCSYDEQKEDVLPYSTISDNEVYEWVTSGNMLGDPDPRQSSNSSIYGFVCLECWEWKTNKRASIETVVVEINKLLESSSVLEKSSGQNNAEQVELDHMADSQENYSSEWEDESHELYNSSENYNPQNKYAIGTPLNPMNISYDTDDIYEEPYEGIQQVAVSDSNNLYAALKPQSERTNENEYQIIHNYISPISASKNDYNNTDQVVTVEEVTEPVSEGNARSSETTDRNCEMEVSMAMGRPGYVERLRQSFLRKSYN